MVNKNVGIKSNLEEQKWPVNFYQKNGKIIKEEKEENSNYL